ncbi:MAG: hypothetical protein K5829_10115 [Treponema sp.]|nr:hypothetical protein [Treponema sp.]
MGSYELEDFLNDFKGSLSSLEYFKECKRETFVSINFLHEIGRAIDELSSYTCTNNIKYYYALLCIVRGVLSSRDDDFLYFDNSSHLLFDSYMLKLKNMIKDFENTNTDLIDKYKCEIEKLWKENDEKLNEKLYEQKEKYGVCYKKINYSFLECELFEITSADDLLKKFYEKLPKNNIEDYSLDEIYYRFYICKDDFEAYI